MKTDGRRSLACSLSMGLRAGYRGKPRRPCFQNRCPCGTGATADENVAEQPERSKAKSKGAERSCGQGRILRLRAIALRSGCLRVFRADIHAGRGATADEKAHRTRAFRRFLSLRGQPANPKGGFAQPQVQIAGRSFAKTPWGDCVPGQAPASTLVGRRTLVRAAPVSTPVGRRTLVRAAGRSRFQSSAPDAATLATIVRASAALGI